MYQKLSSLRGWGRLWVVFSALLGLLFVVGAFNNFPDVNSIRDQETLIKLKEETLRNVRAIKSNH